MFHSVFLIVGALAPLFAATESVIASEVRHPVFDPHVKVEQRASLERGLQRLLHMSDAQIAALVPELNGLMFCGCPNCDSGAQDQQMEWLGWSAPDKVRCKYCGMVFPNDRYPESEIRTALNPRGEKVTYHYYRDDSGVYFFSARASYARKRELAAQALQLAKLAFLTKDPMHERKAVVLLDAFGERYARWCVMSDLRSIDHGPLDSYPTKPHPYFGGIWSRWFYNDIPVNLLFAYDLVHDNPQWQKLSTEKGVDVRKRLEDKLFRASVDFVRGYDETLGNKSPGVYMGLIVAGRVLGEPDYVHDAVDRCRRMMRSQFFFDGIWREGSVNYHHQTLVGLQEAIELADGYSDPEGYRWPRDGARFEQLNLATEFPFLEKAKRAESALVFPNGRIVPIHDGWASRMLAPLESPQTKLLAALEHCCLHRGTGADQMQARLQFASDNGHAHQDLLSLIVWAGGRELLSDIGYTHTAYRRAWAQSTPAHNTIVVDETEQQTKGDRCNVNLFDTAAGLLQTVEAEGPAAYPNITSVYRRQLLLVEVSPEQAYVVDIFRVVGGQQHDWFLHGSADYDQTVTTSLDLQPIEGTLLGPGANFRLPVNEGDVGDAGGRDIAYAFTRDLAQQRTDANWTVTFRFERDSPIELRTTMMGQSDTTVVRGRCPSIRRADEDDSKLNDFTMPVIVARRKGDNLRSTFVAVHEPFRGRPLIQHVRNLAPDHKLAASVMLQIECEGETDIVLCATEECAGQVAKIPGVPPIDFAGRTAFLRLRAQKVIEAYLLDGSLLRCGEVNLTPQRLPEGTIVGVESDGNNFGFHVNEKLPEGDAIVGRTVLATLPDGARHGYIIKRIVPTAYGSTIVLPDDPGFVIGGDGTVDFLYFPQRKLSGPTRYRILTQARWRQTE